MKWYSRRVYPRRKHSPGAPQDDDVGLVLLLMAVLICGILYAKLAG